MNLNTVYRLRVEINKHFPSLSKRQGVTLALACIGLILSRHCGFTRIAEALPNVGTTNTVRQRLKRWVKNDHLAVLPACRDWIRWVWSSWEMQRPILLVDETKLGAHLSVMMVSLAYEGRAIPLIWRCYYGNSAADYPQQGQVLLIYGLLAHVLSALPPDVKPLVQMDRGLSHSSAMIRALKSLKVDFLLRIKQTARFTSRRGRSHILRDLVTMGEIIYLNGTIFTRARAVRGTLYLIWEPGQRAAWCLFTNAPRLMGQRYAMRWWQEESFKDLKSGGWQWQQSRLRCPRRMERWLLVLAIAYGWVLSQGAALTHLPIDQRCQVADANDIQRLSLFRLGLRWWQRLWINQPEQLRIDLVFAPPARAPVF
jgi:hypothetical protein